MILSGAEIVAARRRGDIVIEPFDPECVNPNSYNFHLGPAVREYSEDVLDPSRSNENVEYRIPADGLVLEPGRLYLAHTVERLGGQTYAPTFAARSSVARLGIFINLSASLGDVGFVGQWTLQLVAVHRVKVYAGMAIGQMMWWRILGDTVLYRGKYQDSSGPRSSEIHKDFARKRARRMLPSLGMPVDENEAGRTFATLSRLAGRYPIPAAFVIPREVLAAEAGDGFRSGSPVPELSEPTRLLIRTALSEIGAGPDGARFVVRLSGLAGGGGASAANSAIADLRTADEVVAAVERLWFAALVDPGGAAVFVQRMVDARCAGDARTQVDGHGMVWVTGHLSDGDAPQRPRRSFEIAPARGRAAGDVLHGVATTMRRLRHDLGHDVAAGWLWDGTGLHLSHVEERRDPGEPARPAETVVTNSGPG